MGSNHPLDSWLDDQAPSRTDFAKRIGCSDAHLSLIAKGKRGASLELALAIERETGGAVTARQMFDHGPKNRAATEAA